MHTEMSEIAVLNDIIITLHHLCFGHFRFLRKMPWPGTITSDFDRMFTKKDGVQLVLSNLIKLYRMTCPLNSVLKQLHLSLTCDPFSTLPPLIDQIKTGITIIHL